MTIERNGHGQTQVLIILVIKDFLVTSIYEVPVVEFDKLYVYGNDANFNKQMNLNTYFVIDGNTSNKKKKLIKNNFSDIEIHYWADKYKELSYAIELEKYMYKTFAFLLILISCLGVFDRKKLVF